jgi:hypothetical protein
MTNQRFVEIRIHSHPDHHNILTSIVRWQLRDKPLKRNQIASDWSFFLEELIMLGWVVELENGSLMMTDEDIERYAYWREVKDCGCESH